MARILVIDDNEDMRAITRLMLEDAGYKVGVAADGARGLAEQRRAPAQLVITDMFMPETDGIETILQIRREFPDTKILVVSGGGTVVKGMSFVPAALEAGASKVLIKPVDEKILLASVHDLLIAR